MFFCYLRSRFFAIDANDSMLQTLFATIQFAIFLRCANLVTNKLLEKSVPMTQLNTAQVKL